MFKIGDKVIVLQGLRVGSQDGGLSVTRIIAEGGIICLNNGYTYLPKQLKLTEKRKLKINLTGN